MQPSQILATKLYIPPLPPNAVLRPRLVERLDEGLYRKLTLVSAPAGFGKTTLLSAWVAGCNERVAWLSLDEGDNDRTRFLNYLVAALRCIEPTVGEAVLGALQSPQPPSTESLLTALLNELTTIADAFVLVIDDYHVIDAKPVDDALTFLLQHLPPRMRLVVATREDPQLPLARLRGAGQLSELRVADLRFTQSEAVTTQLGGQRFRCSPCGRRFTRRSTSAFSGRAFPDDIIALAVRWYVRYRLSYAEVSEWLAERGVIVDQSTIYRWVQRYLPLFGEAARKYRVPVGSDWRVDETYARISGRWHYIIEPSTGVVKSSTRTGCNRKWSLGFRWPPYGNSRLGTSALIRDRSRVHPAYVSPMRDMIAARSFFERAIDFSGTTPRRVITDKATTYPPALGAAVPGVLHRTGRYRTNGIERDHGFLKERLRPMRGLKSVASAAIFTRGHALMRNIRRRFYQIVESLPQRLVFAWSWTRLGEAV